jgi:hypothetical protein
MVTEKRPKRVRKVTKLKPGQVLRVRVTSKCRVAVKVPSGSEVAIERDNLS